MKRPLSTCRRAFLRGAAGTALALPLLELTHGEAWSADEAPKRFLTVFSHGGTVTDQSHSSLHDGSGNFPGVNYWKPADPGEELVLGPIMQQLEPFKQKLLLLQGVDNRAAGEQAQYGSGGHGISNVTALTCANAEKQDEKFTALGPSLDHVLADHLANQRPVKFKRIHLNVSGHQYGSPYFSGAGQRVTGEDSPVAAFKTIFEGVTGDPQPDPAFVHQQMLHYLLQQHLLLLKEL